MNYIQIVNYIMYFCWVNKTLELELEDLLIIMPSDECHGTYLKIRQQAITWAYVDPDLCRQMALLGHNELIPYTPWKMQSVLIWFPFYFGDVSSSFWTHVSHLPIFFKVASLALVALMIAINKSKQNTTKHEQCLQILECTSSTDFAVITSWNQNQRKPEFLLRSYHKWYTFNEMGHDDYVIPGKPLIITDVTALLMIYMWTDQLLM